MAAAAPVGVEIGRRVPVLQLGRIPLPGHGIIVFFPGGGRQKGDLPGLQEQPAVLSRPPPPRPPPPCSWAGTRWSSANARSPPGRCPRRRRRWGRSRASSCRWSTVSRLPVPQGVTLMTSPPRISNRPLYLSGWAANSAKLTRGPASCCRLVEMAGPQPTARITPTDQPKASPTCSICFPARRV